jgi:hypothetical protein
VASYSAANDIHAPYRHFLEVEYFKALEVNGGADKGCRDRLMG